MAIVGSARSPRTSRSTRLIAETWRQDPFASFGPGGDLVRQTGGPVDREVRVSLSVLLAIIISAYAGDATEDQFMEASVRQAVGRGFRSIGGIFVNKKDVAVVGECLDAIADTHHGEGATVENLAGGRRKKYGQDECHQSAT